MKKIAATVALNTLAAAFVPLLICDQLIIMVKRALSKRQNQF